MIIAIIMHPVFKVCRKHPSFDPSSFLLIGNEQLGHFSAISETLAPHSGQFISAIMD